MSHERNMTKNEGREDKNTFQNSWNILLGEKVDWVYPAHGRPFKQHDLAEYINHIFNIRLYN